MSHDAGHKHSVRPQAYKGPSAGHRTNIAHPIHGPPQLLGNYRLPLPPPSFRLRFSTCRDAAHLRSPARPPGLPPPVWLQRTAHGGSQREQRLHIHIHVARGARGRGGGVLGSCRSTSFRRQDTTPRLRLPLSPPLAISPIPPPHLLLPHATTSCSSASLPQASGEGEGETGERGAGGPGVKRESGCGGDP